MRKNKILFSFGTRPEVIKMIPLIDVFKKSKQFDIRICNTGQHEDLINSLLEYFEITPDYDLKIMRDSKSLNQTTSLIMEKSEKVLNDFNPDYVFVHGDTTSSFAVGALLYTATSGGLTATQPISATTNSAVVGVVSKSNVNGTILVGAFRGNGTWGSMKAGLA